ncbi:tetratricopeptide repeat protein [Bacillus sp. S/N-304-OC-R1]|uniref:tetratricopeptide repeat protein n=1 Tax=Bacillus sp. S/N-304-OC-R1 TaxID=2758034 RepID=UPI001C8CFA78|nr:tetratricopeptide repeat protein [Bacillus sp. S/N-304-OC-R1]MBY0124418.1 tetratricopeptide repeat protein [Bacillus sp. S/N-304-OC-R1]
MSTVELESKRFVGRQNYLKNLKDTLVSEQRFDRHKLQIIHFFGVGGVGKTSLRTQFYRYIAKNEENTVVASLDFKYPAHRNVPEALSRLKTIIKQQNPNIHFPTFDLARSIFQKKNMPHYAINETTRSMPLVDEGDFVANFLKDLGEITPGVSWIPKASHFFVKYSLIVKKWWQEKGNETLKKLVEMEDYEIEEVLPRLWAEDLAYFLKQEDTSAVILLDTCEELKFQDDYPVYLQIKYLCKLLPEVLWITFGRDELDWEFGEEDTLICEELKELEEEETKELLDDANIPDDVARTIIETTKNHPYYVQLAIETYKRISDKDELKEDAFKGDQQTVVNHFLNYLEHEEKETLMLLSLPSFWDEKIYLKLVKEFPTGFGIDGYRKIAEYSIINYNEELENYVMHPLMRKTLINNMMEHRMNTYKKANELLFSHYNEKLQDVEASIISTSLVTAVIEGFEHGSKLLSKVDLAVWINNITNPFKLTMNYYSMLVPLIQNLTQDLKMTDQKDYIVKMIGLINLASFYFSKLNFSHMKIYLDELDVCLQHIDKSESEEVNKVISNTYYLQGRYLMIKEYFSDAMEAFEKALLLDSDGIEIEKSIAVIYRQQGKLPEAKSILETILNKMNNKSKDDDLDSYYFHRGNVKKNLGITFHMMNDFPAAIDFLKQADEDFDQIGVITFDKLDTLSALGKAYLDSGDLDQAYSVTQYAIELAEGKSIVDVRSMFYRVLGVVETERENYVKAKQLLEDSLESHLEIFGPHDGRIIPIYQSLVNLYSTQDLYKDAVIYQEKILNIHINETGMDSNETIINMLDLAQFYKKASENEKANHYYSKGLSLLDESKLKIDERFLIQWLADVSEIKLIKMDFDSSLGYLERLLTLVKKVHGKKHEEYTSTLLTIANIHMLRGNFKKAIPHFQEALKNLTRDHSLNHPEVAACYDNIGECYWKLKQLPNAERSFEKVVSIFEKIYEECDPFLLHYYNKMVNFYKDKQDPRKQSTYLLKIRMCFKNNISFS